MSYEKLGRGAHSRHLVSPFSQQRFLYLRISCWLDRYLVFFLKKKKYRGHERLYSGEVNKIRYIDIVANGGARNGGSRMITRTNSEVGVLFAFCYYSYTLLPWMEYIR